MTSIVVNVDENVLKALQEQAESQRASVEDIAAAVLASASQEHSAYREMAKRHFERFQEAFDKLAE